MFPFLARRDVWRGRAQLFWAGKELLLPDCLATSITTTHRITDWITYWLDAWRTPSSPAAPSSALSVWGPAHPSTSTTLTFFQRHSLFPPLRHGPILSFHFGMNPFHPSGSITSSLLFLYPASSFSVWLLHCRLVPSFLMGTTHSPLFYPCLEYWLLLQVDHSYSVQAHKVNLKTWESPLDGFRVNVSGIVYLHSAKSCDNLVKSWRVRQNAQKPNPSTFEAVCARHVCCPTLHTSFIACKVSAHILPLVCELFTLQMSNIRLTNTTERENALSANKDFSDWVGSLTRIKSKQLLKWEEFHDNLTSGTQTQLCFLDFHCQHSPWLHLVCGWERFLPKMLFLVWEPPLISLLTSQMINMHLIYSISSEGVRPIQFVLHIILLKCSSLYVTAPSVNPYCLLWVNSQ